MPRGGRADGVAGGEGVRALLLLMAVWARSPSLGVTWELTPELGCVEVPKAKSS